MLSREKVLKGLKWSGITMLILFVIAVIIRIPHVIEVDKTKELVAKIHATKLTLADVMGDNLPPDPGAEADKTFAGIDVNENGIRDDVELAIFKEYPDSPKTRAALLQYALALQMEMTLPILNKETATASVEDNESRAGVCLWTLSSRDNLKKFIADVDRYEMLVRNLQVNTEIRKGYMHDFYEVVGSFSSSNESCDIQPEYLNNKNGA